VQLVTASVQAWPTVPPAFSIPIFGVTSVPVLVPYWNLIAPLS